MAELTTMMTGFSKELLQVVVNNLYKDAQKMQQYKDRLTKSIAEVQQARAKYEATMKTTSATQKYFGKLNDASASLLNSYSNFSNETQLQLEEVSFETAIINLYTIEHEIVDYLTGGLSETNKYAIYYNVNYDTSIKGCEDIKGEFFRGEISPEEIKAFFNVTKDGTIQLRRSSGIIERLQKDFKADNSGLTKKYQTAGGLWEKLTKAILGNLQSHLLSWQEQLQELGLQASREHLGEENWNKYTRLNALFGTDKAGMQYSSATLTQVYRKYMLMWDEKYTGFNMQFMAYNRGHIAEAFERYIVQAGGQSLEPTDEDIINYLNESVGDLPWFAGGDVGKTQVKSLFNSDRAQVQIASASTLCELGVELANLFLNPKGWEERARERINAELDQGAKQSEKRFQQVTKDIAGNVAGRLAEGMAKNVYGAARKRK